MSYFGTDGIRGKFGVLPITPEFALKLGFAAGKVLKRHSKKSKPLVVLGKDTRLSGYILESALQAGLNAAGVYVHLLGPLPTPAIAHLTRALHASLGIVISASHNPYFDNGIKFFSSEGKKLPDAIQEEINQELEKELGGLSFGKLLESYRKGEGLSQKDFAEKLGISASSLCDLEKDRNTKLVRKIGNRIIKFTFTLLIFLIMIEKTTNKLSKKIYERLL